MRRGRRTWRRLLVVAGSEASADVRWKWAQDLVRWRMEGRRRLLPVRVPGGGVSGSEFDQLTDLREGAETLVVSLYANGGRVLVLDPDGHRTAWGPPILAQPGVKAVQLPAEGAEWVCDACLRELDRSYPIPVEDGWALCMGCAVSWGFPSAWLVAGATAATCPCEPCSAVSDGLDEAHRRGLVLNAGKLA